MPVIVRNQAYRKRLKHRPKLPTTIDEVDIEGDYPDLTTLHDGKPYYRGKTASKSELFMSDIQVEIAADADSLFIDGTFSITPVPFFQVLFISAKVGENVFPIAAALMPNKAESSYTEVLEMIKLVCEKGNHVLDFTYIHSDCETAIVNACKEVFPNGQKRNCYFHVTDAIRKSGNRFGCRPLINRKPDLKLFYNRVRQIFFFPPDLWPRLWLLMISKLCEETREHPAIERFLEYLVRTTTTTTITTTTITTTITTITTTITTTTTTTRT